jgi:hypothetical protein
MIPAFNEHGCLPEGIYDFTMEEAAQRFGVFQSSDRRPRLWARFTEFIRQLKECGFVENGNSGRKLCHREASAE